MQICPSLLFFGPELAPAANCCIARVSGSVLEGGLWQDDCEVTSLEPRLPLATFASADLSGGKMQW